MKAKWTGAGWFISIEQSTTSDFEFDRFSPQCCEAAVNVSADLQFLITVRITELILVMLDFTHRLTFGH